MIVYKVVVRDNGRLVSACTLPPWELVYGEGIVTKPKPNSKILAFSTEEYAGYFARTRRDGETWEAEAPDAEPIMRLAHWISERNFEPFWNGVSWVEQLSAPPGTVACSELTLMRRLP